MTDIELAKTFLGFKAHKELCGLPTEKAKVAILEHWLREQLRDGGKNCVDMLQLCLGCHTCTVRPIGKKEPLFDIEGTSDLDALIKAYEKFKELGDG